MLKILTFIKNQVLPVLLSMLLLSGSFAWAWPPTYGAEFELTSKKLAQSGGDFKSSNAKQSPERQEQLRFAEHLKEVCATAGCEVIPVHGKWSQDFKVKFSDNWYFKVSYDPGCVEITFKPSTLEVLEEKKALINEYIFKAGADIGLTVDTSSMAHFNMGIRSTFDDDGMEFLKFFVDYQNHADLALGSLGDDIYNAPPLAVLSEPQREALQDIVDEAKAGKLKTISEIASAIQTRVYTESYYKPWGGIAHYQAIGLKYVNRTNLTIDDAPFELRSMWGQASAETFNKIARLMEARIQFLKQSPQPLIYNKTTRVSFSTMELQTRYFIYVEEAGLKFNDYKDLLGNKARKGRLSPFVDEKASTEKRLEAVKGYWDLILISPYARKTVLHILSLPGAQDSPAAAKIYKRLADDLAGLSGPQQVGAATNPAREILQEFWQDLHNSAKAALSCESIF